MLNRNFNYSYSISTTPYNRNRDKASSLQWMETKSNVTEFVHNVKNGYAFTNVYKTNDFIFSNSKKTDNNIKSCNIITFDFDAVKYSYNEFYDLMKITEIPPTLIYTTQNDGKFKDGKKETYCNRYRVIYVIDKPILNKTFYKVIHQSIKKEIELITNDSSIWNDNTDISISHFFGGNVNAKVVNTNEIYSLDWLIERYNINESNCNVEQNTNTINSNSNCHCLKVDKQTNDTSFSLYPNIITLCDHFMKDFYNLPIIDFLNKYKSKYNVIDATPLQDNNELTINVDSNYTQIRRKYKIETIQAKNGKIYNIPITERLQDGERRRKKLYLNLKLRKRIIPNITLDHLLYIALYELFYYIDNSKDSISKKELVNIAINAFKSDIQIEDKKRPKYKINKEYCKRNNIKPRTANILYINQKRNEKKQERNERIKSIFNPTLTDTENLEVLKENGLSISLKTLRRWKKENGLQGRNTTINKKQHHTKNNAHIANKCDISAVPTNHKESSIKEDTTLQSETENNENNNNTNEMAKKVIISETRNNDYIMLKLLSFDDYINEYYVKAIKDDLSAYNETNI